MQQGGQFMLEDTYQAGDIDGARRGITSRGAPCGAPHRSHAVDCTTVSRCQNR